MLHHPEVRSLLCRLPDRNVVPHRYHSGGEEEVTATSTRSTSLDVGLVSNQSKNNQRDTRSTIERQLPSFFHPAFLRRFRFSRCHVANATFESASRFKLHGIRLRRAAFTICFARHARSPVNVQGRGGQGRQGLLMLVASGSASRSSRSMPSAPASTCSTSPYASARVRSISWPLS